MAEGQDRTEPLRLPHGALFVLVAPSGSGKSTWATRHLGSQHLVSSDELRGVVGFDRFDQRASGDAFAILDKIVAARCGRGLTTVVDSTGLQADRRDAYRAIATKAGVPCHAIVLDVPEKVARARNKARTKPVPAGAITGQWKQFAAARDAVETEGFAAVHVVDDLDAPVRLVGPKVLASGDLVPTGDIHGPQVHLHLGRFDLRDGGHHNLAAMARTAEEVGFAGIWLMDHLIQVPQVGRAWDDMPGTWSTLAWLAAHTQKVRLGSLVSPVTFRPMAVLAKEAATVDVLSGGRVTCGIGLGWFAAEHRNLGIDFPSVADRYALLEDHLTGLPVVWGPGNPGFEGQRVTIKEATGYPRPTQERIPLLVGGNGPQRTLALAARHADAVNLQGDADAIAAGVQALHGHLQAIGRPLDEITVTVRVSAVTRASTTALESAMADLAPSGAPPTAWADSVGAGTVDDQIRRLRGIGSLGVDQVMLSVGEASVDGIAQFAPVIAAMRG